MTTKDLLEETYSAVAVNKVRSGLTMLGIVIGIASVIALQAIGQGAQGSIQSSIQSIGSNLIIVFPGTQRSFGSTVSAGRGSAQTLTPGDAEAIAGLTGVAAVSPTVSGRYQVLYRGTNTNTSVQGVVPAYPQVRNVQLDQGVFITDTDVNASSRVAVIGPQVLQDLFGNTNTTATPDMAIGTTIRIKNIDFRVVGVTKSKGGSGFNNQDDVVYVPLSSAQHFLVGNVSYVAEIDVQATDQQSMTSVQNEISSLLLSRHNISDPTQADFNVLNQADIVAAASSVTGTFTMLLAAIAGISLLVGFPNEAAIKGHKKANWHEVGCARVFVRPLRLSAVARALGRRSPRSNDKRLDRVPGQSAKPSLLQKRGGLGLTVVTVEGLLALGDELLEFISEALPRSAVCADRRIEWLRWRLSDPLGAHSVLVVRDSASSKLVGLAILKMKDYKGMRVGAVFDLIVPRNRGSARKLLLKNAIRKSRLEGCELCLMLGSPAEHNALSMISSGLFPTPKKLMFIVRAVDGTAPPHELLDIRNWHLQLIDHDVI